MMNRNYRIIHKKDGEHDIYELHEVYYDDNGKLAMTHYCMLHNRPSFKLSKSTPDSLTMKVTKIGDWKKDDPAMGGMTLRVKDKNHFESTCLPKGKESHGPMTMKYTRVR